MIALFLIGAAAFPLGFVAFRRLRDRGYILSKTLGLLLLTYFSWLLPSLRVLPYTRLTITLGLLILLGAGGAVAWVAAPGAEDIRACPLASDSGERAAFSSAFSCSSGSSAGATPICGIR